MPYPGKQLRALKDAITKAYDPDDFNGFLFFDLDRDINDYTSPNDALPVRVQKVLQAATKGGWIDAFIDELANARPDDAAIQEIIQRLRAAAGAGPTVWYTQPAATETYFVGPGGFVNRSTLRGHLRSLNVQSGGRRVLLIHGPRRVGKSYTWFLLKHVAVEFGAAPVEVDLRRWGDLTTPDDIMDSIAQQLHAERKGDDRPKTTDARYTIRLTDWLVGYLNREGRACWLFIDHIDLDTLSNATRDLLFKLAEAAHRERTDLRVVLVGVRRQDVPVGSNLSVYEDTPTQLELSHLEEFFSQLGRHLELEVPAEVAQSAADTALNTSPPDPTTTFPEWVLRIARGLFDPRVPSIDSPDGDADASP